MNLMRILVPGKPVSGETIAKKLNVSRQALHKQIASLRREGYKINGKRNLGYVLMDEPDLLTPARIHSRIHAKILAEKIYHFDSLDSTQNKAKELAGKDEPEGAVILAEKQTAGKGRFGREWVSGAGGIWSSVIFRPKMPPHNIPVFSLVLSLAISEAIERVCKVRCFLKWPNDVLVYVNGGKSPKYKKVCGILVEMSAEAERTNWVVAGFGIDANNLLPDTLKGHAVSLKDVTGSKIDRLELLVATLEKIETYYGSFLKSGFEEMRKDYLRKCVLTGKNVSITDAGIKTAGKCAGIGTDGSLLVLSSSKTLKKFFAGEISLKS